MSDGVCVVCGRHVSMVAEGEGPIVCTNDSPEFIMKNLGDLKAEEMNEWGRERVAWAKAVLAGAIPLVQP